MRRYLTNSPQAAARIVALTGLADGDISSAECSFISSAMDHWGCSAKFIIQPVEPGHELRFRTPARESCARHLQKDLGCQR